MLKIAKWALDPLDANTRVVQTWPDYLLNLTETSKQPKRTQLEQHTAQVRRILMLLTEEQRTELLRNLDICLCCGSDGGRCCCEVDY